MAPLFIVDFMDPFLMLKVPHHTMRYFYILYVIIRLE